MTIGFFRICVCLVLDVFFFSSSQMHNKTSDFWRNEVETRQWKSHPLVIFLTKTKLWLCFILVCIFLECFVACTYVVNVLHPLFVKEDRKVRGNKWLICFHYEWLVGEIVKWRPNKASCIKFLLCLCIKLVWIN